MGGEMTVISGCMITSVDLFNIETMMLCKCT